MADRNTDRLYHYLRSRHGERGVGGNGYQFEFFFRREQRLLFSLLDPLPFPLLDVACGSGLMVQPLLRVRQPNQVVGVDFNEDACRDARCNGLQVLRGDAFHLPFADGSFRTVVNSQFLNQQTPGDSEQFLREAARVLVSGGRLVMLWRHARSIIHRVAGATFHSIDRLRGAPRFPQYEHPLVEIADYARSCGLQCRDRGVSQPFFGPARLAPGHWLANIVGASLVIVLEKSG